MGAPGGNRCASSFDILLMILQNIGALIQELHAVNESLKSMMRRVSGT